MSTLPHKLRAGEAMPRARDDAPTDAERISTVIIDIEDGDGPRAAYAALQAELRGIRDRGSIVPAKLVSLERRLFSACCAESQGR
jgi:hypothetical protein